MVELIRAVKELVVEVGKLGPTGTIALSLTITLFLLILFVIHIFIREILF